jgi:small conductance mechanosensitive channel
MTSRFVTRALLAAAALLLATSTNAPPASAADPQAPLAEATPSEPEPEKGELLLAEVDRLQTQYRKLDKEQSTLEGEEKAVVVLQMRRQLVALIAAIDDLVDTVVSQRDAGDKRPTGLRRTRTLLLDMDRSIPRFIDAVEADAGKLRTELVEASEDARTNLETQLRGMEGTLDDVYPFFFDHLENRESLGLETSNGRSQLEGRLQDRASRLSGRVQLLSARRNEARAEADESPGDASLLAALRLANTALDDAASSLWTTCDVMDELGLATTEYRTALIRGTGEITGDVLNADVVLDLLAGSVDEFQVWLKRRGPSLLAQLALFVVILAIFWGLGGLARRFVASVLDRTEDVSELSRRILVGTAARIVFTLGIFVALSQVGVNVTALIAGLGIVGFIVGFALQDTLGNFASGAMILTYRPFDVGDVIEAGGVYGKVHGMSLVSTTILTFDNQTLVVPNSKIWGDVIRNVTAQHIRRVDLEFGLSHEVDVARAEEVLAAIVSEHPQVLDEPEPLIKVDKLTDSATQFVVRPWVRREDYWQVYWDLTRAVKLRLDREKIPLGVPRHDVRLHSEASD